LSPDSEQRHSAVALRARRDADRWAATATDDMKLPTTDEIHEARAPMASLIGKSEKALQKLPPGTWQHTMLQNNLKALRIAFALLNKGTDGADGFTQAELREARAALASMIGKTEKTQAGFSPGTSPHTLQRNRRKALRIAEALMDAGSASRRSPGSGQRECYAGPEHRNCVERRSGLASGPRLNGHPSGQ